MGRWVGGSVGRWVGGSMEGANEVLPTTVRAGPKTALSGPISTTSKA